MKPITLASICCLLASCQSNEIANSKDVNPAAIYTSYNINYTEGMKLFPAGPVSVLGGTMEPRLC